MAGKHTKQESRQTRAEQARDTWTAIIDFFNDAYRVAALQDAMPPRCKRRECRTSGICQSEGVLANDCASPVADGIFDRVFSLIDYRLLLWVAEKDRDVESDVEGLRSMFRFILAEIATRDPDFPPDYREALTDFINVHKRAGTRSIM